MLSTYLRISLVALFLSACGRSGGGPDGGPGGGISPGAPTASVTAPEGSQLGAHDPITVRFSASMDPASLTVGGTLAEAAHEVQWSRTEADGDTLTLVPSPAWSVGEGKTLVVSARNGDGEASAAATFQVVYAAFTAFPPNPTHSSTAVFGVECDPSDCVLQCSLDGAALDACPSPFAYPGLSDGEHRLELQVSWGVAKPRKGSWTWTVDTQKPQLVSARFTAYGELALEFSEPLDAAFAADPGRYQLLPLDKGTFVVAASASGAKLALSLRPYQLPVEYTLRFDARDLAGNEISDGTIALAASANGSRVAFVSAAVGSGDFGSWTGASGSGLVAADSVCQKEATDNGLVGTFRAFASDDFDDAGCRLLRLGGKLSASCGQAAAPVADTGPWIGVDGLPLVGTHAELVRGKLLRQVSYQANGIRVTTARSVWHGTNVSDSAGPPGRASVGRNCSNWYSTTSPDYPATSNATTLLPFQGAPNSSCGSYQNGLLCIQVDAGGYTGFGEGYRAQGKGAFVGSTRHASAAFVSGGLTGAAAADAICQQLAADAGRANAERYVAWLSTPTDDATCRLLGGAGKVSDVPSCGLATPPPTGPWVTPFGFPYATHLTELVTAGPRNVLAHDERGNRLIDGGSLWTGTTNAGIHSGKSCGGWTSNLDGGGGTRGLAIDLKNWSWTGLASCSSQGSSSGALLCLER